MQKTQVMNEFLMKVLKVANYKPKHGRTRKWADFGDGRPVSFVDLNHPVFDR